MDDADKPKMGRPPMEYTIEIGLRICERIAGEAISLKKICEADDMPSMTTVFKWLGSNVEFAKLYASAREAQADTLFDDTLDIADETKEDYILRLNHNGPLAGWEVNGEAIARAKLRIDTRKWMAAKLRPKKYGDQIKVDQTVSVAPDLMGLMERVAATGQRLGHKTDPET